MRMLLLRQCSAHAHNSVLLSFFSLGFTCIFCDGLLNAMEAKWDTMLHFLMNGSYPKNFNKWQRQNLRRYASKFQIKEGDLWFQGRRKAIKTVEEARVLFREFHSSPLGGHSGIVKTRAAICARFYWPGMTVHVENWILECNGCRKVGKPLTVVQPFECNKLNPNYLHSNSTSHTWPFSAIAELIDNAYDPDANAKLFWIDKTVIKGHDCLTFMDNGAGMDYDKMHKMLSFGFNDKQTVNGHVPVGMYGNGFKSGSMRLGKDAIVFSKKADTMCVGLLSQTYLEQINAQHIAVPIAMFRCTGQTISCPVSEHAASLEDILHYSLFNTTEELLCELDAIKGPCSTNSAGTRIIIWNLRKSLSGQEEFDYSTNRYDIRIPPDVYESTGKQYKKQEHVMQSGPESDYSLRVSFQIIIRGQKVRTELISKSLANTVKDKYRPKIPNIKPITITFGFNTKSKEQYGIMMYHKNRLIKAYERVTCQLKANKIGVGVIGVLECNFLKPTHNKQDFDYTDEYRKTMCSLNNKLEEYWKEVHHRFGKNADIALTIEDIPKNPDQNWVQCDDCQKWRKLPDGIDTNELPSAWSCRRNPDPQFRSCLVPEEPEDSDDEQVYQKTHKQHEREEKMKQTQREQEQKNAEQQRMKKLTRQNKDLKRKLEQQVCLGVNSPRSPAQSTPRPAGPRSPDMPVISNVISLSTTPSRSKRSLNHSAKNGVEKRLRFLSDFSSNTRGNPSTSTVSPDACVSLSVIDPDDCGGKEDWRGIPHNEDDIEGNSTPRSSLSPTVKTERYDYDTDGDYSGAMDTNPYHDPGFTDLSRQICMTTQTEQMQAIKQEVDSGEKEGEERSKERERGARQPETLQGLRLLERSSHQEREMSVTSLGNKNGEVKERHSTREAAVQTLESCIVMQGEMEQLRRELDELKKEKAQAWVEKKAESQDSSTGEGARSELGTASFVEVDDELACRVDGLLRELDQRTKQEEELQNRLKHLEEQNSVLLTRCKNLQKDLEVKRDHGDVKSSVDPNRDEGAMATGGPSVPVSIPQDGTRRGPESESGQGDSATQACRLMLWELRHNVGRLLVNYVPALDLEQVNFDCDVIDEILMQVLEMASSPLATEHNS
ncbi:MORC family CW-type zinc finger protein 3a isoform X3 [Brachyhypopomus gauderio]|uniref:MORC family CW-type zinc finger protein 3a isoform X3 n=1 Tax=Brachyhypopomus gauderio TaxID=698409 RepID=UPI00404359F1